MNDIRRLNFQMNDLITMQRLQRGSVTVLATYASALG